MEEVTSSSLVGSTILQNLQRFKRFCVTRKDILLCAVIFIIANGALFYFLSRRPDDVAVVHDYLYGNFTFSMNAEIVIWANLILLAVWFGLIKRNAG